MTFAPVVTLNDDHAIPQLAFGTFDAHPEIVVNAVKVAIETGYRHIDTAAIYQNEEGVGSAIAQAIKEGGVKREDLFVTTKLWCDMHNPESVLEACELSLKKLGLNYVDLYLIHWPVSFHTMPDVLFNPFDPNTVDCDDYDLTETWKSMEGLVKKGRAKSIGVSNFNEEQLGRILKSCTIHPAVNQVEVNVSWPNTELIEFCQSKGIHVEAYAPFGSPALIQNRGKNLIEEYKVIEIAQKHGRKPAQVLLRHAIQRGLIVIAKSITPERIKSNFDVFDFKLTDDEVKELSNLGINQRIFTCDGFSKHKEYPFKKG